MSLLLKLIPNIEEQDKNFNVNYHGFPHCKGAMLEMTVNVYVVL